ncbi:MAG: hypothetical protein QOG73_3376 [Acetobacteraceae bacterium]|jgi:hypothetical protein|nr:hypothetical protein [Acetobacteraceae bacterium]
MRLFTSHNIASIARQVAVGCGIVALLQSPAGPARAQLMDQLKGAVGSGQGNTGGGLLGGSGMPPVGQASPSNTAGVLQYCIQNNYVGSGSAASVKDSLMSKVTGGGQATNDSGYKAGSSGLLQTGNGQNFSLGGDGLKAQITQKVCDQVLQHAKSLL